IVALASAIAGSKLGPETFRELLEGFRGSVSEGAVSSAMSFIESLGEDVPAQPVEVWLRIARLMGLATGGEQLPPRLRAAVENVFGLIMRLEEPTEAIGLLEEAVSMPSVAPDDVYRACTMLQRVAPGLPATDLLAKALLLARLVGQLTREEGARLLSELPPRWLEILADEDGTGLTAIMEAVGKIEDAVRRGRFLERIIEPLIEQVSDREALFGEYLAAAVSEYNKAGNLSGLRSAELDLVQRFFHHEDRRRALDTAISELLRIPGVEGERADVILGHIRRICDALSLQDVWQGKGDRELLAFLDEGLRTFVTAFIEVPDAVDVFDEAVREKLLGKLVPSAGREADENVATWQLRTGSIFFGRVLPLVIELLADDPGKIPLILDKISECAIQSVSGVPAGPSLLPELVRQAEQFLVENLTLKLQARLAEQKPFSLRLGDDWPSEIFENWKAIRALESRLLRESSKVARSITSDRRLQRCLLRQARKLMEGMTRAGLTITSPGVFNEGGEKKLDEVLESVPKGEDLVSILLKLEKDVGAVSSSVVSKVSARMGIGKGVAGESPAREWRKKVFSQLGNACVSLLMIQEARSDEIDRVTDNFLEVVEFLGNETGADNLLLALEHAVSVGDAGKPVLSVEEVCRNLEKQLFKPLWRRRAMSRLELLTAGRSYRETITDRLLDRLGREEAIYEQVGLLRCYGQLFLVIEEAVLRFEDKRLDLHIHDTLKDTWLFNRELSKAGSRVDIARDAVGTASDVFRQIRMRTGVVTEAEAEEISHEMRRKYRDNAGVVAIFLRWTLDPEKEDLLKVLEGKPILLETVSKDTELAELMDSIQNVPELTETVRRLASDPARLKARLKEMKGARG
ncbi:hypothetical protein JW921_05195, partial [Candidatus Fermentibacterales bacterium]|nr:hypothetical protein [Candidatus Fermentibacterales bacterium]